MGSEWLDGKERDVYVCVQEVCPNHFGEDCCCRSGFIVIPVLYNNKVILDLYNLVEGSIHDIYLH